MYQIQKKLKDTKKQKISMTLYQAQLASDDLEHSTGISWWLALTIFLILFVAALYYYSRAKTHNEREQMCWRYLQSGSSSAVAQHYLSEQEKKDD
jgi:hypothetical protein